jgi:hypothetical protein
MTRTVWIDRDRLWNTLMELGEIGAYDDEATGVRGVRRLALTDADAETRHRCVLWMSDAGLEVIETLRDVEVGFFTEEEGVRFGTDMLGSPVTAGRIPLDVARKLTDSGPTAMVLVAGENGDIGHTPREYPNSVACGNGTDVLAGAVLRLVDRA